MLIRVRSKDGNFRFDLQPTADISELFAKIIETTSDADLSSFTISNQPRGNEVKFSELKGRTVKNLGLNHGDLVFVGYQSRPSSSVVNDKGPGTQQDSTGDATKRPWELVTEDSVDSYWRGQTGMLPRGRDAQFCWEDETRIRELAKSASTPLTIVGYIFTDLDPTPEDRSKNVYKRHPGSFYLSSLEAIFAATVQKANPTPSRSSSTGQFASRLVTAVLTATEDGHVDVSAYQVSEQAVAMVEADMIEASVEPGIVRVKEEDRSQETARYVPDVFFTYKNEYGLEVKKSAKPCFPVEYLMVNVTHGFPQNPSPIFKSTRFKIENRPGLEDQSVEQVLSTLLSLDAPDILESRFAKPGEFYKKKELATYLSDWHLVAFLGSSQLFSPEDMKVLIQAVSRQDLLEEPSALDLLFATDGWQTLMTFTRESAPARPPSSAPIRSSSHMDEDIPQEVFDQIAAEEAAHGDAAGSSLRVCPHFISCVVCMEPFMQHA
ncbi:hypothetical protein C0993_012245 [Termitomyces sp. T159_Od127]|nr:hypothetical protein C0993_012245 [Termitomyces sp. T159_Od127]